MSKKKKNRRRRHEKKQQRHIGVQSNEAVVAVNEIEAKPDKKDVKSTSKTSDTSAIVKEKQIDPHQADVKRSLALVVTIVVGLIVLRIIFGATGLGHAIYNLIKLH